MASHIWYKMHLRVSGVDFFLNDVIHGVVIDREINNTSANNHPHNSFFFEYISEIHFRRPSQTPIIQNIELPNLPNYSEFPVPANWKTQY